MTPLSGEIGLLELRKSERTKLADALRRASPEELENLVRNIENTLSRFQTATLENEEQIYLFGLDINHLLRDAGLARSVVGALRDHLDKDVAFVFACGFVGLNPRDAREKLANDRRRRRVDAQTKLKARQLRHEESTSSMVEDIAELVSETAATLQPPDIIPRK